MTSKETEFITILYGESISLKQAQLAQEMILALFKNSVEVNLINGEQPIYHFIVSIE